MPALVRHDLPEPLHADEGPRAELNAPRAAHQTPRSPAEARVQHDGDVGNRWSLPQGTEPPQDPLDPAGVGRFMSLGRSPSHARRC